MKIYADDTKLYKEILSIHDCQILQHNLNCLYNWSEEWQLCFHPDKCHALRLGNSIPDFQYYTVCMSHYQGTNQFLYFVKSGEGFRGYN